MKSLKKNYLYTTAYQLLLILLPLITTPYVSRVLGVEGIGSYSYTYTIARYFVLAAMLGVQNYGNRSIAAVRDDKAVLERVFCEIYGLQLFCSAAAAVLYFCFIFTLLSEEYQLIALIQGLNVASAGLDISWFFFGLEEFRLTVTRNILIKLATLAGIFLFVRNASDLWIYTLLLAGGTLLSQGYLWFFIRRYVHWQFPGIPELLRHLKPELLLFIPVIAVSLYKLMDKVMLEGMSGVTQVGLYESAEKVINIPMGLITALGTVMLPRMSHLAARGDERGSRRYLSHSLVFTSFLAAGLCFGIVGTAPELVPVYFGPDYLACIPLLMGLAPTVCFISWANVIRTQYLIPRHLDRSYTESVVLGAFVNLILNLIFIPILQAKGAVIGTVCAEAVVCIYQTAAVRKALSLKEVFQRSIPFYIMGASMLLLIRWIGNLSFSAGIRLVLEILGGGLLFVILSVGYMILKKDLLWRK